MNTREDIIEAIYTNMQKMHRSQVNKSQIITKRTGLTPSQIELLFILKHSGPLGAKAIAASMSITAGAATHLLEQLDILGLITRKVDERDKRATSVSLSTEGTKKLKELMESRKLMLRQILETLEADELGAMLKVQEKLITYFEKELTEDGK